MPNDLKYWVYLYTKCKGRDRKDDTMKRYVKLVPLFVLVFAAGLAGYSKMTVDAQEERVIPDTVYIGDTDVSGMTAEEAEKALGSYVKTVQNKVFTLTTGDKQIQVSAEDLGLSIADTDVLIEEALNIGRTGNLIARYKDKKDLEKEPKKFDITFDADEEKIETLLGVNEENLNQEAVNCGLKRENGAFTIIDGANGIEVNTMESVTAIQEYLQQEWDGENATIDLVTKVTEPQGTKEELSKVKDVLGSFHTDYSSSAAGRAKNVRNGAELINGSVVYPGEQFSVYEAVSPFDAEHGYALAGSYENGTVVETYGGGICQVSTTLYNAVIRAELEITERFAHSMIVNYVEPSMDAAIAGTYKDLKFKNNTEAPIYIEGITSGGIISFNIYGQETRDPQREVIFESEIISVNSPKTQIQGSASHNVGYVSVQQSAHVGKVAKLWKIVKMNGVEQSREEFNNSNYSASPKIILVGTNTASDEARAYIQNAIASQNEAGIYAAAAQAANIAARPQQPEQPEEDPAETDEKPDDEKDNNDNKDNQDGKGDKDNKGNKDNKDDKNNKGDANKEDNADKDNTDNKDKPQTGTISGDSGSSKKDNANVSSEASDKGSLVE